jgi:shikimate dehydrogenase
MKVFPNNKTKVFISVSKFPGNTGSNFHNSLFNYLKLNSLYFPLKLNNEKNFKKIILDLNIAGCSVSMPFKKTIFKFLDKHHITCKITKNVNTIINKKHKLIGYNTDFMASNQILDLKIKKIRSCLLLGNGSVAKTIYKSLKLNKIKNISLSSRSKDYKGWGLDLNDSIISWKKRNSVNADLLINATPIGMIINDRLPIKTKNVKNFKNIIDLPINDENKLKKMCKKLNINYISGHEFAFIQALEQFKLYSNGKKISYKLAKKIVGK